MAHAELSPSSAKHWMTCPGSVALSAGLPDESSEAADEGTAAHFLASEALTGGFPASDYLGGLIAVPADGDAHWIVGPPPKGEFRQFKVDADMVEAVQRYIDYVRAKAALPGATLMVEQKLAISQLTGEAGATGTTDALVLVPAQAELDVTDLKFGKGVQVEAEGNEQLAMYALSALDEHNLAGDYETVRMVIHQPRTHHVVEWVQTVEQMEAFRARVEAAAAATRDPNAPRIPSTDACRYCKGKANCPELTSLALEGFENIEPAVAEPDQLADIMDKADLIEGFIKAVRAEVTRRLFAGKLVRGYKVVQGKRGNRAWVNDDQAEAMLKTTFRVKLEDMYQLKLITPTAAEELVKTNVIGPRQWPKLKALITQADGYPSVAPASDKRDALVMVPTADGFEDLALEPSLS